MNIYNYVNPNHHVRNMYITILCTINTSLGSLNFLIYEYICESVKVLHISDQYNQVIIQQNKQYKLKYFNKSNKQC